MSALTDAVAEKLSERVADGLTLSEIEKILADHKIPTSATRAIPVPLRATRIHFWGTKQLPEDHATVVASGVTAEPEEILVDDQGTLDLDAVQGATSEIEAAASLVPVPFDFDWSPQPGVNGIGSGKNLRGKSTVLNVLMWALTGRCAHFQPDVQQWIEGVEVFWQVGSENLRVAFTADDGRPVGTVSAVQADGKAKEIGTFDGEEQFEGVMGSAMMSRLRLEQIPVWAQEREVRHAWPAYSSALTVRADTLNPVVGNENTIGVRMLQMFVGTDWAPGSAAARTALRSIETQRVAAQAKASAASEVATEARDKAQKQVVDLQAQISALPPGTPKVGDMLASTSRATELAREVHELERRLMADTAALATVEQQLRTARVRENTLFEDARLTKFFHRMKPTICPRCAEPVTEERHAAEVDKHECSLCTHDLGLEDVDVEALAGIATDDGADDPAGEGGDEADDQDGPEPVDSIVALEAALSAGAEAVDALRLEIAGKKVERDQKEAAGTRDAALVAAAEQRQVLSLQLARAEGAYDALSVPTDPGQVDPVDDTVAAVITAADLLLADWVKEGQIPLLANISADIEKLAILVGADSLSRVRLGGGGRLDVRKGANDVTYTKLTAGERLRVKIATAVALIRHGYASGVGRHPGLLVLDSPAAEEMPEEDLATMVEALKAVADEAEMQIFVATRNTGPLTSLLPEANRRVAIETDYVW